MPANMPPSVAGAEAAAGAGTPVPKASQPPAAGAAGAAGAAVAPDPNASHPPAAGAAAGGAGMENAAVAGAAAWE